MPEPLPDARDRDLARRLEAGDAPDGSDALHDALERVRPEAPAVSAEASARLWAGIAREAGLDRAVPAPDRAARPGARTRVRRWVAAAAVVAALGAGFWLAQRGPAAVIVAQTEVVTWTAPDGSTIVLRPHSRLVHLAADARAYELQGQAYFDVERDPSRPFTVEAGAGTVRVLGTRFDVSTWGERTDVFVEEGRVAVGSGRAEVELAAGEAATVAAGAVSPLPDARAEAFLDWRRGEVAFEREPVGRVASEIGQHFGIAITMDEAVAGETVTGTIALETAPQTLGELGRILGGRFVGEGTAYRFERP